MSETPFSRRHGFAPEQRAIQPCPENRAVRARRQRANKTTVIKDKYAKRELRESWSTVLSTVQMVKANIVWAFAGGGYTSKSFRDLSYSLIFLFAFSVVEDTLLQLRDEGKFNSKSSRLGALMEKSKNEIPWVNYSLIDEARNKRNRIAHQQEWLGLELCLSYIKVDPISWTGLEHY